MKPTDLAEVLQRAWTSPFSVKSDYARQHAELIAAAASKGLITTQQNQESFGTSWLITLEGLKVLWT